MALPSEYLQISLGYKHSLSKAGTDVSKYIVEEKYKSSHNINDRDIWADTIDYCVNETVADNFVATHPSIIKKYTLASLTVVPGTNNLAWYLNDGGKFVRPWVIPTDIPHLITNEPSHGFLPKLFRENNTQVPPTLGVWLIDAYSGLVIFQEGQDPITLGWGTPKITCYVYIGKRVRNILEGVIEGTTWQAPVTSKTLTNPSTITPVHGERFIVGINSIGAWENKDNQIAIWDNMSFSWSFVMPERGVTLYVVDETSIYNYNNTNWVLIGGSAHASNVYTNVLDFSNVLSPLDVNVQTALNTIDKIIDNTHVVNNKTYSSQKITTLVKDISGELVNMIESLPKPLTFKGEINTSLDFPTLDIVQSGWTYIIKNDVIDNLPEKTNTGQAFITGDEIAWNNNSWVHLGSTKLWEDTGTDVISITERNINLQSAGIKDNNVSTPIKLGDVLNTEFNTTNKTILGSLNEVNNTTSLKLDGKQNYGGFENRMDSTYSIDSNGIVVIEPILDSYNIYCNGIKITIDSPYAIQIVEDQTLTYVYFDYTNGLELKSSTTAWDIKNPNIVLTLLVYKDDNTYAITDERHSYKRNIEWHSWAHNTIGAMYYSGLEGNFTNTTFSISQGVIYDEDIRFDTINTKTTTSLWYRSGVSNKMRIIRNSNTPYHRIGDVIQYDNEGILTSIDNNKYAVSWVYCSNDSEEPIYTVLGQNQYDTLALAQNTNYPIINLTTAEWKLLYKVIFQNKDGVATYIDTLDYRSVQAGTPIIAYQPNSHSSLINRDVVNSHPSSAIEYDNTSSNLQANNVKNALDEISTLVKEISGDNSGSDINYHQPFILEFDDNSWNIEDENYIITIPQNIHAQLPSKSLFVNVFMSNTINQNTLTSYSITNLGTIFLRSDVPFKGYVIISDLTKPVSGPLITDHNLLHNRDEIGNHTKLSPLIDSTQAIQVTTSNNTPLLVFDTINEKINVSNNYIPTEETNIVTKKYTDETINTKIDEISGDITSLLSAKKNTITTIKKVTGGSFSLDITDTEKFILLLSNEDIVITIEPDSIVNFAIGTQIDLQQIGEGTVMFNAGEGVTIYSKDNNKKISAQYVGVTLIKIANNTWSLFGDLSA